METSIIKDLVTSQILKGDYLELKGDFDDSIAFYTSLLGNINNISPIKSFTIAHNTSDDQNDIHTNLTIICFEQLPKSTIRQQIIDQVNYDSDEYPEYKFLANQDILILSFDF